MLPLSYWIIVGVTILAVVLCVILHYESLRMISAWLPTPKHQHRRRIVFLILCLLLVHVAEIWIFGSMYFGLLSYGGFGELIGIGEITFFNCVYYSATIFTTVGFGDIVPVGAIRFPTGTEAIAGLTFITWSASYTFMEMLRVWNADDEQ
jgi:hypothetical protein